jgi:hypothetical protein
MERLDLAMYSSFGLLQNNKYFCEQPKVVMHSRSDPFGLLTRFPLLISTDLTTASAGTVLSILGKERITVHLGLGTVAYVVFSARSQGVSVSFM